MKRIIFINRFYRPDLSATSQVLTQLVEGLAASGMSTAVIAGRGAYDASGSFDDEILDGVQVYRVGSRVVRRRGIASRAIQSAGLLVSFAVATYRIVRPGDVVVVLTDPPMIGPVISIVARLRGARLVHWIQDLFPETAAVVFPRLSWLFAPIRRWRNRALRGSAHVVAIGAGMHDYLVNRDPKIAPEKVTTIGNWANDNALRPLFAPMSDRRACGVEADRRLLIGYQGNLGRAHDSECILGAALELSKRSDVRFVMTGGGAEFDRLKGRAAASGVENIEFRAYVPPERLNASLSLADVHLVSLNPALEGFIVPSKLYSAFAVGRGVIFLGAPDGEVAQIISRTKTGETIEPHDHRALAALVERLVEDEPKVRHWGETARAVLEGEMSQAAGITQWRTLMEQLLAS